MKCDLNICKNTCHEKPLIENMYTVVYTPYRI